MTEGAVVKEGDFVLIKKVFEDAMMLVRAQKES